MLRAIAACGVAALVLAGAAAAAPPALLTAGASGDNATATWSLPQGGETWTVEVASSPDLDTDGGFVAANVVDISVLMDGSTSWTGTADLAAGTYYVHVSGQDTACSTCAVPEWSSVKSLVVGGSGTTGTTGSTDTTTPVTTSEPSASTPSTSTAPTAATPTTAVPGTAANPATAPSTTGSSATRAASSPQVHGPNTSPRVDTLAVHPARTVAHATVRACDDRPGRLTVRAVVRRGSAKRIARSHLVAESDGCWPYLLSFRLPHGGSGRVTVTLRLRDAAGAWSRPFVYRLARSRS